MDLISILFLCVLILFLVYFLIDLNYFIRSGLLIFYAKFFRTKIDFLSPSEIYGIVLPNDADIMITHMNNGRVFREFDFGRWDHFVRTGMLRIYIREKGQGVVGAHSIRYRRPLHMFMVYKIVTQIVYFDAKSVYFEQKIVTLRDDIIRAVGYVRLVINLDVEKLIEINYPKIKKPKIPEDLQQWLKFNEFNSNRLNAKLRAVENDETASLTESDKDG